MHGKQTTYQTIFKQYYIGKMDGCAQQMDTPCALSFLSMLAMHSPMYDLKMQAHKSHESHDNAS